MIDKRFEFAFRRHHTVKIAIGAPIPPSSEVPPQPNASTHYSIILRWGPSCAGMAGIEPTSMPMGAQVKLLGTAYVGKHRGT
jgi:hypothetical protein